MIINKVELQGFKSFPEKTKIIFHPGITAVIGPNGTGKSNIVDALLWVLGGQRAKSQRGERSGDAIFNGNIKAQPMGMADVVLTLSDEEERLNINHRLFRSGESEYRLNGKVVRLKDIQDALWKRSIAEKDYFVIEQGQIGLFLTSKPIEKRLLLEEAAGTAYYKDKKKQAQNKLENSEQNLIRLEDIISEVSTAKNSLKRQAGAAIRYRKLREKIRELTALHYRKRIELLEKSQKEVTGHYESQLNQEKEMISRLKSEENNLAIQRKKVWDQEKFIKEIQENLYVLKSKISQFESDREKEARRIEFFEEKKNKAKQDRGELKEELLLLEKEISEGEAGLGSLRTSFGQKQNAFERANQESELSKGKLTSLGRKLEALRTEHLQMLSEHTEMKNEGVKIDKEIELILRQEEKLKNQASKEQVLLLDKEKELKQNQKKLSEIEELKKEKEKRIASHQKELEDLHIAIKGLEEKISALEEKKDEGTYHLQALEKLKQQVSGLDFKQHLPGVLGLLADYVETEPDHVPLLDVFWKEEAKASLILVQDFLKIFAEKDIKGNFLLLSPQKKKELPSEIHSDPGVIGLLKSSLRPSPKIKDYFDQLQEAVIVEDIQIAIQLWLRFPSLNYITLQGELLFSSGLLKLEGKKEGIFTLSQETKKIKEHIHKIEKEVEPLRDQLKGKTNARQKVEESIKDHSSSLSQLEREAAEIKKEYSYLQTEKEKIETNLTLFHKEREVFGEDRQSLIKKKDAISLEALLERERTLKNKLVEEDKKYAEFQEKNEKIRKTYFELRAETDLIQEKTSNLDRQLEVQKQRVENLNAKLSTLHEEIKNCDEVKSNLKENIENLLKRTKNLEAEKKTKESHLTKSELQFQHMKEDQEELEKKIEKLREDGEVKKEERVKWEVSKAETERDLVNLEESCWQDLKKTLQEVKKEITKDMIPDLEIEQKLEEAKEKLQKFKSVNLMAEEEYEVQKKRFDFLVKERKDLRESIDTTRDAIKKIDQESKSQFLKALDEVNTNFQEVFSLLFSGGAAELKLTDSTQPLESGVEIIVQPPGKKVQNMNLLSGGEKSLTSLAFFFSLFRYRPTPFCILDEVDAALDDANLAKFLDLMKKVKTQTQFIIITHNYKTMEVADYIYGTTMAEPNITSLISIKLEKKENLKNTS